MHANLTFRCEHCRRDKALHWRVLWGWVCKSTTARQNTQPWAAVAEPDGRAVRRTGRAFWLGHAHLPYRMGIGNLLPHFKLVSAEAIPAFNELVLLDGQPEQT